MHIFEVYIGMDLKYYWRLKRRGHIVADGSEGFASRSNALRSIKRMVKGLGTYNWKIKPL